MWARRHVAATSPKPPCKTAGWQKQTISRVRGPKISDFRVRWSKSNFDNSSMAKNGLLPFPYEMGLSLNNM
jgi:hypothetical protein